MTEDTGTSARGKLAAIVEAKRAGDPFVDPLSSENLAWWALRYSEGVLALIDTVEESFLFEPGRKGDAAARGAVFHALRVLTTPPAASVGLSAAGRGAGDENA